MNTIIEVWDAWYTTELVESNPDCLFVFGDNLKHKGHGGQAIIRDCSNTFGIPTKREPNKFLRIAISSTEQVEPILRNCFE